MAIMMIGHSSWVLEIEGISSNQTDTIFTESKYTTYLGEYKLKLGTNDSRSYTACQSGRLRKVRDIDGIFNRIKGCVKKHISENIAEA